MTQLHLRPGDREKLETIIAAFQEHQLKVYATGSVLEHQDYEDIDLVLEPGAGGMLDSVTRAVQELQAQGARVQPSPVNSTYSGSLVLERYQVDLQGTNFDVVYTIRAGALYSNPDSLHPL